MLAAAVTLALFGFILTLVIDVMRRDGGKILAALDGRSWAARPASDRSVTVRFTPRGTAAEQAPGRPGLRAAA